MSWRNLTNLVKDEPIKSSSHGDSEEDIGEIAGIKQHELQHCLRQGERQTNITSELYTNVN